MDDSPATGHKSISEGKRHLLRETIRRSVQASAALEGRTVPPDFKRSAAVQAYLDSRK